MLTPEQQHALDVLLLSLADFDNKLSHLLIVTQDAQLVLQQLERTFRLTTNTNSDSLRASGATRTGVTDVR